MLFETPTGEVPHAGPTAQVVIAKVTTIEPRSVTAVGPSVPAHIAASVGRAPDGAPGSRFTSVDAFIAALDTPHVGEGAERPIRRLLFTSGHSNAALVGAGFVAAALGFTAG